MTAEDEPRIQERISTLPFLSRILGAYRQVPSSAESAAQAVQAFEMTALDIAEDARNDGNAQQEVPHSLLRLTAK